MPTRKEQRYLVNSMPKSSKTQDKDWLSCNHYPLLDLMFSLWLVLNQNLASSKQRECTNRSEIIKEVLDHLLKAYLHKIEPGLCSIIKVEDVSNPLLESPEKVSEALILFCQGQGLMPTINRRASRQLSQGSDGQGRLVSSQISFSLSTISVVSLITGRCQ